MEQGLTKNQIITELTRSPHGKLEEYLLVGRVASAQEPEFLAHLVAWNQLKGQIRDSKVALPVLSLAGSKVEEWDSNALASLVLTGPRGLRRAFSFARVVGGGRIRTANRLIERFLKAREANWPKWERMAVQHRRTVKALYALTHTKPGEMAERVLFQNDYPKGSIFAKIANLKNMSADEAAGVIIEAKIPFLVANSAMGAKIKEPNVVLALTERMTATELVTNTKMLDRMGVKSNPALRAAYEKGLEKVAGSTKVTLKTTRAAQAVEEDEGAEKIRGSLSEKLRVAQEKQMAKISVEGDWLVLGDKSGSMAQCIEAARHIAATLAKLAKGKVHLIFFDVSPRHIDATGRTYEEILSETKHVTAAGGTSIGCGLRMAIDKKLDFDGIVVVSDGCENTPPRFADVYSHQLGRTPPVYFYHIGFSGPKQSASMAMMELTAFSNTLSRAGIDVQKFALSKDVDYYSIPNLAQTMRVSRYGLVDEIMNTPLISLDDVLPQSSGVGA